jgi:hypothetical protein
MARIFGGLFTTWILVVAALSMGLFLIAGGDESGAQAPVTASCMVSGGDFGSEPLPHGLTPATLNAIYTDAANAPAYSLGNRGPAMLKAINRVETNFGRNAVTSSAGAKGWMQFIPSTWNRFRVDVRQEGRREVRDIGGASADWDDPQDAIHTAANYLHRLLQEHHGDWRQAIYGYNHSWDYVDTVVGYADGYEGKCTTVAYKQPSKLSPGSEAKLLANGTVTVPENAPELVKRMIRAANQVANKPYLWGGGHPPSERIQNGYDCSGYTMFILHAAGMWGDAEGVASQFQSWGEPGHGKWVTIYAKRDHVFMVIAGRVFNSGGTGRPGSAWRQNLGGLEVSQFVARHPHGL